MGYYIDDEPPWRWDIDPKSWSRWREDFEGRFKVSFPESLDEASERQKASYMRWLLQKYIDYIRRFRKAVKNVNPDLKIAICYNPEAYRSGFIRTADEVDLILVDLYPGWMGDPI
ncbi:beta-galactosidase [Candidatus Bathyarchaeota archaeon]|nr:beta-galactosidase [Candidatus Bathyarchaeota archaeon]